MSPEFGGRSGHSARENEKRERILWEGKKRTGARDQGREECPDVLLDPIQSVSGEEIEGVLGRMGFAASHNEAAEVADPTNPTKRFLDRLQASAILSRVPPVSKNREKRGNLSLAQDGWSEAERVLKEMPGDELAAQVLKQLWGKFPKETFQAKFFPIRAFFNFQYSPASVKSMLAAPNCSSESLGSIFNLPALMALLISLSERFIEEIVWLARI